MCEKPGGILAVSEIEVSKGKFFVVLTKIGFQCCRKNKEIGLEKFFSVVELINLHYSSHGGKRKFQGRSCFMFFFNVRHSGTQKMMVEREGK
jgi:hypothetical protein